MSRCFQPLLIKSGDLQGDVPLFMSSHTSKSPALRGTVAKTQESKGKAA